MNKELEMLISKGYDFHKKGQLSEAKKAYDEALKINPKDERVHYYLGYVYDQEKEYDKAESEYKKVIEINPKNYLALNNLGLVLQAKKKIDEAMNMFNKAIKLKPEEHLAHFNLGRLYAREKNQLEDSEKELRIALRINSKDSATLYGLAFVLQQKGEKAKAAEMYKKMLELDPKYEPAKKALAELENS